jgi:uncharacterized protein
MKINTRIIQQEKEYVLEDELDFSNLDFSSSMIIRNLNRAKVNLKYRLYEDYLYVDLLIEGEAILICSYTLEDVNYPYRYKDSLTFCFEKEFESEDVIYADNAIIDMDEYVLGIILASLPSKVVKKGARLPSDGAGYRVMSEDDYLKETANKKDSRFDVLENIEFDED